MADKQKYWKGLEELNQDAEFVESSQNEFPDYLPMKEQRTSGDEKDASRRDFLKLMGFSVAAVSLAACETPVKNAIPWAKKPEQIDPGKANYYASTYVDGGEYASVLVKTREGRPIGISPNPASVITGSGVTARVSASVLSLYDNARSKHFYKGKEIISIKKADKEIKGALKKAKNITLVTPTVISPSANKAIMEFQKAYGNVNVIAFDPISQNGLANVYGGALPTLDFSKAQTIVGFSCDFLGTWNSSIEYARQYAETRKVGKSKKEMSRHFQFESNLSLTGSNADYRARLKASEEPYVIAKLYDVVASKLGEQTVNVGSVLSKYKLSEEITKMVEKAGAELVASKGKSLVVAGSNDTAVQYFVQQLNKILGNEGKTIDTATLSNVRKGNDEAFKQFVVDAAAKKVDAVVFYNTNPVYNYYESDKLVKALKNVGTKVALADRADETASECDYLASTTHWLENWSDANPRTGVYSVGQPTISPLFSGKINEKTGKKYETRCAEESILAWAGNSTSYYDYVKANWENNILPGSKYSWQKALTTGEIVIGETAPSTNVEVADEAVAEQADADTLAAPVVVDVNVDTEDGVTASMAEAPAKSTSWVPASLKNALNRISKIYYPEKSGMEVVLYESVQLGSGSQANNPWLQETPDPLSKVTWDNYAALSLKDANAQNLKDGDLVEVMVKGKGIFKLPVVVQPGQAEGTIGVALGYGREKAGQLASGIQNTGMYAGKRIESDKNAIGVNVYPLMQYKYGTYLYFCQEAKVTGIGEKYELARTQTSQTILGRNIVQGGTLSEYKSGKQLVAKPMFHVGDGKKPANEVDLWKPQTDGVLTHPIHHWNLSIDLNSCIGCSACHVSCQSENNIPVVGKDEVRRRRDMHWMRIDRYYSSDMSEEKAEKEGLSPFKKFELMEKAAANPNVTFQPMLCQHCNHAPCETVCPVSATNHSTEGLNQMAYNRCIGTRYCANNCPYKVRRFNWFNYSDNPWSEREFKDVNVAMNDDLGRMVLNPDVTVRARGVMEKCSMCVQRIQNAKLTAKIEKRKVEDGEFTTACASACPTNAITFGDFNNQESALYKEITDENKDRRYDVLEELGVQPNVHYLAKIKNVDKEFKF